MREADLVFAFCVATGTCVLGWAGLVVLAGCLIKSIDYGNGADQWNVSITNVGKYVKVLTYI